MRKSDFSDVLAKARAAQAAGDASAALQQLSSFIDVQKPILVSRSMPKVITEPFLPVLLLHNELAISLHELPASRQSLNHYRKLFSFSAPFTVDQAFRDYIRRVQSTLDGIGPDFDHAMLAPLGGSNERATSLFSVQLADLHKYPPQARTVIFAFLALRMIVDTLRCTTMVGLYRDALEALFLLCSRFNRKHEFIAVTDRVLSGFMEMTFKSDLTVAVEYLKDRSLTDVGEVDSDLGPGAGMDAKSPESEYEKPNTLVSGIYCKLVCIPFCHTFGLPTLAIKLLESSAADILLLTNSISRACAPLHKLSCEYLVGEETPDLVDMVSTQSIIQVYAEISKGASCTPCSSVQDLTTPLLSTLSKERGLDNVTQLRTGPSTAMTEAIGTKGGASPATFADLNAAVAAHLKAAISVFSSEGYLFAAGISLYKAVKLISSLDQDVRNTLINEAFAILLSLRQDSMQSSILMNHANMFGNTRSTNPSFFINHPSITRLTPASMVTSNAFCFDRQVHAISLESNPVYQTKNLANGNSFAAISETITSISVLDYILQDIIASYSDNLQKGLLDLVPLLYTERDLLITVTAEAFVAKAADCLLRLYDNWSLGESCVYLQEALAKKAISLLCIERAHDSLLSYVQQHHDQDLTLDTLTSLTTQVTLDDVMVALKGLFSDKLANDDLYKRELIQQTIIDALRCKTFIGRYNFVSQVIDVLTYATVSAFYLNKVDACFTTNIFGSAPHADSKASSNLAKSLNASTLLTCPASQYNNTTLAQLVIMQSLQDLSDYSYTDQRSVKLKQIQSSAKLRTSRIQEARELEQQRLQEYKEMVIQRQKRDEALDLEAQNKQRKAKRAAEIRQLQIKLAKQFIEEVAGRVHDTDLINYLTSFDLESVQAPNDFIKIKHHQFEHDRAQKRFDRDVRISNLAELTLLIARKEATDRLKLLDSTEHEYLQPILMRIHETSQNYEKEKHMESMKELALYDSIPGLDEFVESYISDCRQVYTDLHSSWKADRDKVLEEIQNEVKAKQNIKAERMNSLMNRAKAKTQATKKPEVADLASKPEQKANPAETSKPEEKTNPPPVRSYADKFLGRK